uniref:Granule-bound starch synthase n=1 Tax=Hordeum vulgare TaxID=4513 RepID=A0A915VJE9_HORVU|nr:GBSSI [Hordeum vulgare]BDR29168.1 granule-bound starch synthase [Hordeum vulgare]BDR29170.1 granule-bound starch synthase [Hordeum vulgare]
MAALATSQLATSGTVLGVTDRFRRPGFQGLRPRNPADAALGMRTIGASAAPKQSRKAHRGSRRCLSVVVSATGSGMNLVFVGAEMAPWSKTGGLGDVLGGLPPAMAANGHRVMVVSPRYDQYKDAWDTSVISEIKVADEYERVRFFHCYKRGVDRVFIDHPWFLEKVRGKTKEKIYGPDAGTDYEDNQQRFSLLCQAALEAPRILNLNNNPYFSGPYGKINHTSYLKLDCNVHSEQVEIFLRATDDHHFSCILVPPPRVVPCKGRRGVRVQRLAHGPSGLLPQEQLPVQWHLQDGQGGLLHPQHLVPGPLLLRRLCAAQPARQVQVVLRLH